MDLKIMPPELLIDRTKTSEKLLKPDAQNADKSSAAVKKAAKEFEALFASMMLKSMRDTVGKDKLTGGGQGEDIYRSMLDQEYANVIASRGGLGLASLIERELKGKK